MVLFLCLQVVVSDESDLSDGYEARFFAGELYQQSLQTAPPRGASGECYILSPHGALRAYTVFLTAEPRRGSSLVLSSLVTVSDFL